MSNLNLKERINNINKSQVLLFVFFLSLFIIGTILISVIPTSVKSSCGTVQTSDGEIIAFNTYEPVYSEENRKKAVIIGHGLMANKEFMKGYAIELAAAGFVAVPFDFRGHGQSTGDLSSARLIQDVRAIKSYLEGRGDINMNNLSYIGFSMGGGPGNEIVNTSNNFSAFVGVGTSLRKIRNGTATNPLNVLMVQAKFDEAFELSALKQQVGYRVGLKPSNIDTNQLYGSFQDGNATKIYLDDNSNHLTVAWDADFLREARDWIINTFPETPQVDENFYANARLIILIIQLFGGLGIFVLIINGLASLFNFEKEPRDEKANQEFVEKASNLPIKARQIEFEMTSTQKIVSFSIISSLLLGIPGTILMFLAVIALPLAIEGFVLSLLFGQTFGLLILLWRLGKRHNLPLVEIIKKPLEGERKELAKSITLGLILAVIIYGILYASVGRNYLGIIPSIVKLPWLPVYLLIAFIIFFVYNLTIQLIVQPRFSDDFKSTLKVFLIFFGVQFIYLNVYLLMLCALMQSLFFYGTMIPVATPILLISTLVAVLCYRRTGNIISGTLCITIFFVLIVSTISPYQSFLSLLGIFLH
jgi:pimeloyl-ACP methyl ester carboxylesterase